MKKIKHVAGPCPAPCFPLGGPRRLTYQPKGPLPRTADSPLPHYEEFDLVAREIQPVAMCYIGSSLITHHWKDIDMMVLLPDGSDLGETAVPEGYLQTSPTREGTPELAIGYPDVFRCFRKGIYNLILITDSQGFDNFRRASLLMKTLADADDLLRMALYSKEARIALYNSIGSVDE